MFYFDKRLYCVTKDKYLLISNLRDNENIIKLESRENDNNFKEVDDAVPTKSGWLFVLGCDNS